MASNIHNSDIAKYNKNYQNVNNKPLQLISVHFLTLKGHLACAIFDFDIASDIMDAARTGVKDYSGAG
jgi:hypothetical protein